MSLSIGQVVSGYELLDYLDSSSKRIAFRARNISNRRIEQLQILPDGIRDDPERSARFFRECRILATLRHPNIVTCHGVLEIGGHLAISVEALEAVTLADRLELGPLPVEEAVRSVLQILGAADAAHSAGVVHREISPANVLITPENLVKLTGFASAKSIADPNLTRKGALVGNATYTSPEVYHGSTALDPRIDIYAIGCVFYALVTGRPPFVFKNEYEMMLAHVQKAPEPPSSLNPAVNSVLDAVILKALAKDPAARYQSAGEFYHCILNPDTVYVPPSPAAPDPPDSAAALPPLTVPVRDPEAGASPVSILSPAAATFLLAGLFFFVLAFFVLKSSSPAP